MSYSTYAADTINDAICNDIAFSLDQLWVQLHIGDPGATGIAFVAVESARQAARFAPSSGGVCSNDDLVSWAGVAATETYTFVSFWDAIAGGNFWGAGELSNALPVTAGQTATFDVGALSLTTT